MLIDHLEIFVEEPSMEAFLLELLPRLLPRHVSFSLYTHNGKSDLLRKLPHRLRGYANWMPGNHGIVVVVDRDNDDCVGLKTTLEGFFAQSGIVTKMSAGVASFSGLTRIAVEELEAWYFGNWPAVVRGYPILPSSVASKAKYRNSDDIRGGTWEAFERICKSQGLFSTGLRKVEAARKIGGQIEIGENSSPSFAAFREGLISMVEQGEI